MNIEAMVDEVMNAAIDLIEVVSYETELLALMSPDELTPLLERKQNIAQYYQGLLRKMQRRRAEINALSDARRAEMVAVNEWLQLLVAENARALRAAYDANDKFLQAVKHALETTTAMSVNTYSDQGTISKSSKMDSAVRASIGYNEVS